MAVLVGVTNLNKPNFLDRVTRARNGRSGSLLLSSARHRIVVTASVASRIMEELPPPGVNPLVDRFIQGQEGSTIGVSPVGGEVLASAKRVPLAGWYLVAILPTDEAFAPIRDMQRRTLLAAWLFTLVAGAATALMLRRQLAPMRQAAQALERLASSEAPELLAVGRDDEVGQLIGAFNRVVARLTLREAALKQSEADARAALHSASQSLEQLNLQKYAIDQHAIVATTDVLGRIGYVNDRFCEISGYSSDELLGQDHSMVNSGVHPKGFFKAMYRSVARGEVWHGEVCNRAKAGHLYWLQTTIVPFMDEAGKPRQYIAIRADITQRKAAEQELQLHREQLENRVQLQTADLRASAQSMQAMLLDLERQREVLRESEMRFQLAIEGADEGIWDWNFATNTFYHSPRMAEMLGYSDQELPPTVQAWAPLASEQDRDHYFAQMKAHFIDPAHEFRVLVRLRHRQGDWRWIESHGRASRDANGRAVRFTGTHSDVTERKTAEEAAHAANHAKSEFLANMSHEIRTPMNGVVGMADILMQTEMQPSQRRMLGTIHDSALALLHILNDVLDYSKIEAGMLQVESIATHLRELTEDVAELMLTNASAQAIELSLFVSPQLPQWIATDPNRLRQVLLNLLGNAIKFTHGGEQRRGRVDLTVEPCALGDGAQGLRLVVSDNGIGIDEEAQRRLFQPFTQADESTARRFGGTGLGLSISQRLVALMHGRITVQSRLGEGSVFTVELPLRESRPARATAADPRLDGVQVIALSLKPSGMKVVPTYCTAAGASFSLAADLDTARELAREALARGPTVVLLGLSASALDAELDLPQGVGLVRLLRRTGDRAADASTVLARPLRYLELVRALLLASRAREASTALAHGERRQGLQRPAAPQVEQACRERRLILLAEDNETNREVLLEQLHILGYAAEVAQDGEIALRMWRLGHGRQRYALLLTDCHMPRLDGFELTHAIRASEPAQDRVPIIAVTANAMQGEAQRCIERGMDDYLSKPLRLHELGRMLAKWLPQQARAEQAPATDEAPGLCVWDAGTLSRLIGDDSAMHERLLRKFLANAQLQASSIAAACVGGDLSGASSVAHTLKSAARTVGALALGELCQRLETAGQAADGTGCLAAAQSLPMTLDLVVRAISNHLDGAAPQEAVP